MAVLVSRSSSWGSQGAGGCAPPDLCSLDRVCWVGQRVDGSGWGEGAEGLCPRRAEDSACREPPPEPCLEELGAKWPLPLWTELKLVHLLE